MRISDWSSDVCSSDLRKQDSSAAAGPQRPASGQLELLLDAAEDRAPPAVEHLDAHAVAELEKGRLGGTVQQGLHRALHGDVGVAAAALVDRLARPSFGIEVGNRAGAAGAARAVGRESCRERWYKNL